MSARCRASSSTRKPGTDTVRREASDLGDLKTNWVHTSGEALLHPDRLAQRVEVLDLQRTQLPEPDPE